MKCVVYLSAYLFNGWSTPKAIENAKATERCSDVRPFVSVQRYIVQARTKCATLILLLDFDLSISFSLPPAHPPVRLQLCFMLLFEIEWVNACRKCNAIKLCNMLISRATSGRYNMQSLSRNLPPSLFPCLLFYLHLYRYLCSWMWERFCPGYIISISHHCQ